ncbi:polymer-forming cytoskeletal protein [soil metagenome]
MFNLNRTQRPEPDAIEVIIGPRATFSGVLRCDASVRIDGAVEAGHIETPANVILTETARVQCDITARTVSIRGIYRGTIRADRVELLQGSQIYGALYVDSFFMDDGVLMRAELNIQSDGTEDETTLTPRPDNPPAIPIIRAFRNKG